MKRAQILSLVFVLFIFASVGFAQTMRKPSEVKKPFHQGTYLAQVSVGFVSGGFYGSVKVPPMNFGLEYGISDEVGVGFLGGYGSSKEDLGEGYGFEYSYLLLSGSVSYHFDTKLKNLDAYAKLFAGYVIVSASAYGPSFGLSAKGSFAGYGTYVGAIYYVSPQFGVQGEVGYGNVAIVRFGVSLKF